MASNFTTKERREITSSYIRNKRNVEISQQNLALNEVSALDAILIDEDKANRENFHIYNSIITQYSLEESLNNGTTFGHLDGTFLVKDELRVSDFTFKRKVDSEYIDDVYQDVELLQDAAALKNNDKYGFYEDVDILNYDTRNIKPIIDISVDLDVRTSPSIYNSYDWNNLIDEIAANQSILWLLKHTSASPTTTQENFPVLLNPNSNTFSSFSQTSDSIYFIKDNDTNGNYLAFWKILGSGPYQVEIICETGTRPETVDIYSQILPDDLTDASNLFEAFYKKLLNEFLFYLKRTASGYELSQTIRNQNKIIQLNILNILEEIESVNISTLLKSNLDIYQAIDYTIDRQTLLTAKLIEQDLFDNRYNTLALRMNKYDGTLTKIQKLKKGNEIYYESISKQSDQNSITENFFTVKEVILDGDGKARVFIDDDSNIAVGDEVYLLSDNETVDELHLRVREIVKARAPKRDLDSLLNLSKGVLSGDSYQYAYKIFLEDIERPTKKIVIDSQYNIEENARLILEKDSQNSVNVSGINTDYWRTQFTWSRPRGSSETNPLNIDDEFVYVSIFIDTDLTKVNDDIQQDLYNLGGTIDSQYRLTILNASGRSIVSNLQKYDTNDTGTPLTTEEIEDILYGRTNSVELFLGDGKTYFIGVKFEGRSGFAEQRQIIEFTPNKKKVYFSSINVDETITYWNARSTFNFNTTDFSSIFSGVEYKLLTQDENILITTATVPADYTDIDIINDYNCNENVYVSAKPTISALEADKYIGDYINSRTFKTRKFYINTDNAALYNNVSTLDIEKINHGLGIDLVPVLDGDPAYTIGTRYPSYRPTNYVKSKIHRVESFFNKNIDIAAEKTYRLSLNTNNAYDLEEEDIAGIKRFEVYSYENDREITLEFGIDYDSKFFQLTSTDTSNILKKTATLVGKNKLQPPVIQRIQYPNRVDFILSNLNSTGTAYYKKDSDPYDSYSNTVSYTGIIPSNNNGTFYAQTQVLLDPDWFTSDEISQSISPGRTLILEATTEDLYDYELLQRGICFFVSDTKINAIETEIGEEPEFEYTFSQGYISRTGLLSWNTGNDRKEICFEDLDPTREIRFNVKVKRTTNYCDSCEYLGNGLGYDFERFCPDIEINNYAEDQFSITQVSPGKEQVPVSLQFPSPIVVAALPRDFGFYLQINRNFISASDFQYSFENTNTAFNSGWITFTQNFGTVAEVINNNNLKPSELPSGATKVNVKTIGNDEYYDSDIVNLSANRLLPVLDGSPLANIDIVSNKRQVVLPENLLYTIVDKEWGFDITINTPKDSNAEEYYVSINGNKQTFTWVNPSVSPSNTISFDNYTSKFFSQITFEVAPTALASNDYRDTVITFSRKSLKKSLVAPIVSIDNSSAKFLLIEIDDDKDNNEFKYKVEELNNSNEIVSTVIDTNWIPDQFYPVQQLKDGTRYSISISYRNNDTDAYVAHNPSINIVNQIVRTLIKVGVINFNEKGSDQDIESKEFSGNNLFYVFKFSNITSENSNYLDYNGAPIVQGSNQVIRVREGESVNINFNASYKVNGVDATDTHYGFNNYFHLRNEGQYLKYLSRVVSLENVPYDFRKNEIRANTIIDDIDIAPVINWRVYRGTDLVYQTFTSTIDFVRDEIVQFNSVNIFRVFTQTGKNSLFIEFNENDTSYKVEAFASPYTGSNSGLNLFYISTGQRDFDDYYKWGSATQKSTSFKTSVRMNPTLEFINQKSALTNTINITNIQAAYSNSRDNKKPNYYEIFTIPLETTETIKPNYDLFNSVSRKDQLTPDKFIQYIGSGSTISIFGLQQGTFYGFVILAYINNGALGLDYNYEPQFTKRIISSQALAQLNYPEIISRDTFTRLMTIRSSAMNLKRSFININFSGGSPEPSTSIQDTYFSGNATLDQYGVYLPAQDTKVINFGGALTASFTPNFNNSEFINEYVYNFQGRQETIEYQEIINPFSLFLEKESIKADVDLRDSNDVIILENEDIYFDIEYTTTCKFFVDITGNLNDAAVYNNIKTDSSTFYNIKLNGKTISPSSIVYDDINYEIEVSFVLDFEPRDFVLIFSIENDFYNPMEFFVQKNIPVRKFNKFQKLPGVVKALENDSEATIYLDNLFVKKLDTSTDTFFQGYGKIGYEIINSSDVDINDIEFEEFGKEKFDIKIKEDKIADYTNSNREAVIRYFVKAVRPELEKYFDDSDYEEETLYFLLGRVSDLIPITYGSGGYYSITPAYTFGGLPDSSIIIEEVNFAGILSGGGGGSGAGADGEDHLNGGDGGAGETIRLAYKARSLKQGISEIKFSGYIGLGGPGQPANDNNTKPYIGRDPTASSLDFSYKKKDSSTSKFTFNANNGQQGTSAGAGQNGSGGVGFHDSISYRSIVAGTHDKQYKYNKLMQYSGVLYFTNDPDTDGFEKDDWIIEKETGIAFNKSFLTYGRGANGSGGSRCNNEAFGICWGYEGNPGNNGVQGCLISYSYIVGLSEAQFVPTVLGNPL